VVYAPVLTGQHAIAIQQLEDEKAQLQRDSRLLQETVARLEDDLSRATLLTAPQGY
jgi:hypothetical protein